MAVEPEERERAPFDENPPVDPSEPQVGNSRARFFMPREEGPETGAEDEEEEEEEAEASPPGDGAEEEREADR